MTPPERQRLDEMDRAWSLDALNGLAGARERGRELARAFEGQFAAPAGEVRYYFSLLRLVRGALAEGCWPSPGRRRGTARLPVALRGGEAFSTLLGSDRIASAPFLVRALDWLAANVPARRDVGPAARTTVEIADWRAALAQEWRADPRTRPLGALAESLRTGLPEGATPILFGSLAEDGPWPAYADVDLGLWLAPAAWRGAGRLRQIGRAFGRVRPATVGVDPLQHHGPYLFFDFERELYGQANLPLAMLTRATTLHGGRLTLSMAPPLEDRLFALLALVRLGRGAAALAADRRKLGDRYLAKYLVSLVLLAPALALGAAGRPMEKGASFAPVKAALSPAARETLEDFEGLRREWRWALRPPSGMLRAAGGSAHRLARTLNRWPAPDLARRLGALVPGLDPLFREFYALALGTAGEGGQP